MTNYTKAGRMIRLIGWLFILVSVVLGLGFLIPYLHDGASPSPSEFSMAVPALAFTLLLAIVYLVIGAYTKRDNPPAATVASAWALSIFALVIFPVGTVIGLLAIVQLYKGRSAAKVAA